MNHQHVEELNTQTGSWPFIQWGINLIGPLKNTLGNRHYLIVAIDYFLKWIEVEPLTRIMVTVVKSFVWKNIIH